MFASTAMKECLHGDGTLQGRRMGLFGTRTMRMMGHGYDAAYLQGPDRFILFISITQSVHRTATSAATYRLALHGVLIAMTTTVIHHYLCVVVMPRAA